jgi:hypothetical protein
LKVGIPVIDAFTAPQEIADDWQRHRTDLLAEAERTGRAPWAATVFEPGSGRSGTPSKEDDGDSTTR